MAKLRNYEIDAITNNIVDRLKEIKKHLLKDLSKKAKLSKEDKEFLNLIDRAKELNAELEVIQTRGKELYKKMSSGDPYWYNWINVTEKKLLENNARLLLPEKLQNIEENKIKDAIIIQNLRGEDINDFIDNFIKEYCE